MRRAAGCAGGPDTPLAVNCASVVPVLYVAVTAPTTDAERDDVRLARYAPFAASTQELPMSQSDLPHSAAATHHPYDAIVIGARCAGSPTAMLLARRGFRVLLVDRATFPSDSMRAHFLRGPAIAALQRWGLLEQVVATGCPPLDCLISDFGDGPLRVPATITDGVETLYAPRRYLLDTLLVKAAAAAGAEIREAFTVDELLWEEGRVAGIRGHARGGAPVSERTPIVIGADGWHSLVAKAVAAPVYDAVPTLAASYYSYFAGIPTDAPLVGLIGQCCAIAAPTNDDLTLLYGAAPIATRDDFRADLEGTFWRTIAGVPWIAEIVRGAERAERWRGTTDLPNYFRRPYGPGWALVGDAGYHQDPITARGISNAFQSAEFLAEALQSGFSGREPLADALATYERRRNEVGRPVYEEALQWAGFRPFPPELYAQRAALRAAAEADAALAIA